MPFLDHMCGWTVENLLCGSHQYLPTHIAIFQRGLPVQITMVVMVLWLFFAFWIIRLCLWNDFLYNNFCDVCKIYVQPMMECFFFLYFLYSITLQDHGLYVPCWIWMGLTKCYSSCSMNEWLFFYLYGSLRIACIRNTTNKEQKRSFVHIEFPTSSTEVITNFVRVDILLQNYLSHWPYSI